MDLATINRDYAKNSPVLIINFQALQLQTNTNLHIPQLPSIECNNTSDHETVCDCKLLKYFLFLIIKYQRIRSRVIVLSTEFDVPKMLVI